MNEAGSQLVNYGLAGIIIFFVGLGTYKAARILWDAYQAALAKADAYYARLVEISAATNNTLRVVTENQERTHALINALKSRKRT